MARNGRRGRLPKTVLLSVLVALLAAAPASAATRFLDPNGTWSSQDWSAVPSTTPHWDLINDGVRMPAAPSSATDYLRRSHPGNQDADASFTFDTELLDAGETVTDARLWVHVTTSANRDLTVGVYHPAGLIGYAMIPGGLTDSWFPVALNEPATQSQIDNLYLGMRDSGGQGETYVHAAYVELQTSDPPAEDPPVEDPPAEDPPVEDPPVEDPPVEDPPVEDPPAEDPPAEDPPAEDPPAEDPPAEDPPAEDPPAEDPPVEDPPAEDPPAEDPPAEDPPAEDPPAEDPPAEDPPAEDPPAEDPPAEDPPNERLENALKVVGTNLNATARGLVPVALECASTQVGGCAGVMTLEELPASAKKRPASARRVLDVTSASALDVTAARRGKRVGRRRYKLAAGEKTEVPIQLERRAFRKFKKKKSVRLRLVIEQKDANGQVVTLRRTVRVFPTKKRR
ncbi:MAG: hypothetical protein M3340_08285 [Actinomycetota bacterium]|nr:hypothetical protein [Actinomycetota bacterium]